MARILFKRHLNFEAWANQHFQFSFFLGNSRLRLTPLHKTGTPATMLAPDIVAAILDDALSNHLTLFDLAVDPP
ncbi:hypothetical protein [Candidatus Nitrotoga sp. 1052]|uniref:hypothetical protein n=1 Tax=Candidatus Nitrotoga sp. 1052 TaxID=2886964 RepID=UPI001EF4FCE1|nr:hypothetical protein [Candidatus Nitrotoga sp. 1052]CAH1081834.1 hypothetical protein NTG1052_410033 [Candidatus Nitrotoga sp. 1052]